MAALAGEDAVAGRFSLHLSKEDFKFSASHFICHAVRRERESRAAAATSLASHLSPAPHGRLRHPQASRERLHGHNYRVSVDLEASGIGEDGYVVDFGEVKKAVRALCRELDERFLCPMKSPHLEIEVAEETLRIRVLHDHSRFSLPVADAALLPIAHSSSEELARLLATRLVAALGREALRAWGVRRVGLAVEESAGQSARFVACLE